MNYCIGISKSHPASITLTTLEQAGWQAWIVGGWVRDAMLGRNPHDADIACNASWQNTAQTLRAAGFAVHETGVAHGTVTAIVGGCPIEVTTYRVDGPYSDARRPDYVRFVDNIDDDLARRDFTMNAMAFHPQRGLRDPYGGASDIEQRAIRAVGCPKKRFEEDPLRILRALRFSSQLGFAIEDATHEAVAKNAHLLKSVAAERTGTELGAILLGPGLIDALSSNMEVVQTVLPEFAATQGFALNATRHSFDLFGHLLHSAQAAPQDEALRWAALLHDIAKPRANKNHAQLSAQEARRIMRRLRLARTTITQACDAIALHEQSFVAEPAALRLFIACLNGDVERARRALQLQRADALGHGPQGEARAKTVESELTMLDDFANQNAETKTMPLGTRDLDIRGDEVRDACAAQGAQIAQTLDALLAAVIDGEIENRNEALLSYCETARNRACPQLFQKRLEKFLTRNAQARNISTRACESR